MEVPVRVDVPQNITPLKNAPVLEAATRNRGTNVQTAASTSELAEAGFQIGSLGGVALGVLALGAASLVAVRRRSA